MQYILTQHIFFFVVFAMNRFALVASIVSKIENGVFVEIGTHTGAFADHILSNSSNSVLYCIDPYMRYEQYDDAINNVTGDDLYRKVSTALTEKFGERIRFVRQTSKDAVGLIPEQVDFIYIDGNHRYTFVREDLELYYPKLKPACKIVGDDAVDTADKKRNENGDVFIEWPHGCYGNYGVIKAFDEFVAKENITGRVIGDQYLIEKPDKVVVIAGQRYVRPRLMGRLGNHAFILATAIAFAIDHNRTLLIDEKSSMDKQYFQNVFTGLAAQNEFKCDCTVPATTNCVSQYERAFSFAPLDAMNDVDIIDLCGYYQSELYFAKHVGLIRKCFAPSSQIVSKLDTFFLGLRNNFLCENSAFVSIHVRRGDYLQHATFHTNLTVSYYKNAMQLFYAARAENEKLVFVVFSDDIAWCISSFSQEFATKNNVAICFVGDDELNGMETLFAMARCERGNIIANSTLSWWGAFLNRQSEEKTETQHLKKTVVAPMKWFENQPTVYWKDVYCEDWLVLTEEGSVFQKSNGELRPKL